MKKLLTTLQKDIKLSFNGLYFYIELGLAVIFILIMLFVVPENFDKNQTYQVFLNVDDSVREQVKDRLNLSEESTTAFVLHDSMETLHKAMEKDRNTIGIAIQMEGSTPSYNLVLQGYESESMKALIQTTIEGEMLSKMPDFKSTVTTRVLEPGAAKLSDRANILPIYLTMNVALMGLFIIAAYIFLDKDEGVIKAFAVAPVPIWQYLLSKVIIMSIMGVATSLMVCLAVVGLEVNYFALVLSVLAFSFFGSSLGLLISSFFNAMMKAMGAMYLAIMVLMFATVSYMLPSFTPSWIKWFPSYPMLFSFRALLLRQENMSYVYQSIAVFTVLSVALFAAANWRFKKTLTV